MVKLLCTINYIDSSGKEQFTKGKIYKAEVEGDWFSIVSNTREKWPAYFTLQGSLGMCFTEFLSCDSCTERKCNTCSINKEIS
jgi:hypothetical protein